MKQNQRLKSIILLSVYDVHVTSYITVSMKHFFLTSVYRSAQEKKYFFRVHSAKKIVKGEILQRKLREISRKFTQGSFLLSEFSRRHSVKLAEKHPEITWSFSAKFRAVTPRKLAEAFKEETFTET